MGGTKISLSSTISESSSCARFEGNVKEGVVPQGSFRPSLPHCLIVSCLQNICRDVCKNTRKTIHGMEALQVRIRLYIIFSSVCADFTWSQLSLYLI